MLTGDFFEIVSMQSDGAKLEADLKINATHNIFNGHFPGVPVVPGVCMIQMVKELAEKELVSVTRLTAADQIKFLTVLNPKENDLVHAEIKYKKGIDRAVDISATLLNGPVIYFKMRANLICIDT